MGVLNALLRQEGLQSLQLLCHVTDIALWPYIQLSGHRESSRTLRTKFQSICPKVLFEGVSAGIDLSFQGNERDFWRRACHYCSLLSGLVR